MSKNASRGITALHVFLELSDALLRDSPVSLGILQDKVKEKLSLYLTDGRSRSIKKAIELLDSYGLVDFPGKNQFGEPVYSLRYYEDRMWTFYLSVLQFLSDITDSKGLAVRIEQIVVLNLDERYLVRGFTHRLGIDHSESGGIRQTTQTDFIVWMVKRIAGHIKSTYYEAMRDYESLGPLLRMHYLFYWLMTFNTKKDNKIARKINTLFLKACLMVAEEWLSAWKSGDKPDWIETPSILKGALTNWLADSNLPERVREGINASME